jgi:Flp pilus assembly pilin Flp
MHNLILKLYLKLLNFTREEAGQDLIETALATALIGIVAIASMSKVGSSVNTVFSNVSKSLA